MSALDYVIWMTWNTLLLTSLVSALASAVTTQTPNYDVDRLKDYARLSQQLRAEIAAEADIVLNRIQALQSANIISTMRDNVDESIADSTAYLVSYWNEVHAIDSSTGSNRIPAVQIYPPHPYTSVHDPIFSDVKLDFAMNFDSTGGRMVVTKPGIYFLEVKVQTKRNRSLWFKINVLAYDGTVKHAIREHADWEISPFFEMLDLEAGDVIEAATMRDAGQFNIAHSLMTTSSASQLIVRYLGEKYDTPGAADVASTTAGVAFPQPPFGFPPFPFPG